jgi:hypothetical protein
MELVELLHDGVGGAELQKREQSHPKHPLTYLNLHGPLLKNACSSHQFF